MVLSTAAGVTSPKLCAAKIINNGDITKYMQQKKQQSHIIS